MNTTAAALTVAAVLLVGLPAAYWRIKRAEAVCDRLIRERADAARETDDLELAYSLPAYDPAWEAGMERLWNAIRDEQTKGDL